MIRVEHKDLRFGSRLENFLSPSKLRISSQDSIEIISRSLSMGIINGDTTIDIITVWFVEDFTREWVLGISWDIVIGHHDNV